MFVGLRPYDAADAVSSLPFDETALTSFATEGDSSMSGMACKSAEIARPIDPQRVVLLIPATAYTTEYIERELVGREILEPPVDARLPRYLRTTVVDEGGRFRFVHLPAGEYYLTCRTDIPVPQLTRGGVGLRDRRAT